MFLDRFLAKNSRPYFRENVTKKRLLSHVLFLLIFTTLSIPAVAVMSQPSAPITTQKEAGERNYFAGEMKEPSAEETLVKTKWAVFVLTISGVLGFSAKNASKYRTEQIEVKVFQRGVICTQEKIARNMLNENMDISTIAGLTGLTSDQVETLSK